MIAVTPALATDPIISGVVSLLSQSPHYLASNNFTFRRIQEDARKIVAADAATGHLMLAYVQQLVGDREAVRYHLDNALKLGVARTRAAEVGLICSINLGQFSAAQAYFAVAEDPRNGTTSDSDNRGLICGAFRQLVEFGDIAMRMGKGLPDSAAAHNYRLSAQVLDVTGTTDEETAALLDLAGQILHERRLFVAGIPPDLITLNDEEKGHCVFMTFLVRESPEVVAEMGFTLAERAAEQLPRIPPGFSVGFTAAP